MLCALSTVSHLRNDRPGEADRCESTIGVSAEVIRAAPAATSKARPVLATFLTTAARTSGTLNQQRDRAADA